MKAKHTIIFSYLLVFSCAKWEQHKETSFDAVVTDITTGKLTEKAHAVLYELETPSAPFSSIKKTAIQEFLIAYDEPFSFTFNAKRGERFEYELEFIRNDKLFNSDLFGYDMIEICQLSKKENNQCELEVVPSLYLSFSLRNIPPDASELDSIWVDFQDGVINYPSSFKGIGTSPSTRLKTPHGHYTLSYTVYDDGVAQYSDSYPVELKHNRDTSIVVEF